jgi:hypothetical protein
MEVVVDYEYLTGSQNETVIKEVSTGSENCWKRFIFKALMP